MILITEFMDEEAIDFLRSKYEVVYDKELANKQQDIPNKMKVIIKVQAVNMLLKKNF